MLTYALLCAIMVCQVLLHGAQENNSTAFPAACCHPQHPPIHYHTHTHIENNSSSNNTNTQTQTVSQQKPIEKCLSRSGKELIECMECLSSADYYHALENMNPRQRSHYLKKIPLSDVKRLHHECPIQTWMNLQKNDPECIANIKKAIHAHKQEESSSVWEMLGATLICVIAAASGCGNN